MAHPNKKEGVVGANAKLKRMTQDYGMANKSMYKTAPVDKQKAEGPEDAVGYGAEDGTATARGDRPARKSAAANPIATYKKGGAVKTARAKAERRASGGGALARADGGRIPSGRKGATNVNIIVAPQGSGGQQTPPPVLPVPLGAGPDPKPPMPSGPPPGAPPGLAGGPGMGGMPPMAMAPGAVPPGLIPPRKRGGGVHADVAEDKSLVKQMVKPEALKRARGGKVGLDAGAATGEGRLEKAEARASRQKGDKSAEV